jgi:protein phosphatase
MIKKSKIEEIFFKNNQTEAIAEQLLQESLTSGGFDNITLIVVGYSEE